MTGLVTVQCVCVCVYVLLTPHAKVSNLTVHILHSERIKDIGYICYSI